MTYEEMRKRQHEDLDQFKEGSMFFAYSEAQFREGMRSLGLDPDKDRDKIYSEPGGAYCLCCRSAELWARLASYTDEVKAACAADPTGEGFIAGMFLHELAQHEYLYTEDITEAVQATPYTLEEIRADPALSHGLDYATQRARGTVRG